MSDADHGPLHLEVFSADGKVKLGMGRKIDCIVLEPGQAVQVAKAMMDAAQDCGWEITIEVPRRNISEQQRAMLVTRVGHILRSMREKPPALVAVNVVDVVLQEAL